jgi:hypothetical protein
MCVSKAGAQLILDEERFPRDKRGDGHACNEHVST